MALISVRKDGPRLVPVPGRVVGVDPGLNVTGYAVVEPSARGPYVLEAGVIRPQGGSATLGERISAIYQGIVEVLDEHMLRRCPVIRNRSDDSCGAGLRGVSCQRCGDFGARFTHMGDDWNAAFDLLDGEFEQSFALRHREANRLAYVHRQR